MSNARHAMTVRIVSLHSREAAQPPTAPAAADRLRLVHDLSEQSWRQTGRQLPPSSRRAVGCVLRPLRTSAALP